MVKQPQIAFARRLRREMSLPERLIWGRIKGREAGGPVFRRQYPFDRYVFDFYCARIKLVIEIDGWGHNMGSAPQRDEIRDRFLLERGFEILRIPASDVLSNPDDVAEGIYLLALERLKSRNNPTTATRSPSPEIRGG